MCAETSNHNGREGSKGNARENLYPYYAGRREQIGKAVLDAAFKLHTGLGPALLELVYEACCAHSLRHDGESVETQVALPVTYHDVQVDAGLRLDMLVAKKVIVEFKAVETMITLYDAQLLTYLKLTGLLLGYLLNFNVQHLKDGIKRFVLCFFSPGVPLWPLG